MTAAEWLAGEISTLEEIVHNLEARCFPESVTNPINKQIDYLMSRQQALDVDDD